MKPRLLARMTALQPANSSFLQLALTDRDPQRAALTARLAARGTADSSKEALERYEEALAIAVEPPDPI